MTDQAMRKFLEVKRKYEDEGYKFFYIFEMMYVMERDVREKYAKKLFSLEEKLDNTAGSDPKKMGYFLMSAHLKKNFDESIIGIKFIHVATEEGFSKQEFGYIGKKPAGEAKHLKCKHFIEILKKMVSNKLLIPDKSVLLLKNNSQHQKPAGKLNVSRERVKMKREKLSQVCLQFKMIIA